MNCQPSQEGGDEQRPTSMMGAEGGPMRSVRPPSAGKRLLAARPLQIHATTNTVASALHDHAQLLATPLRRHQEIMEHHGEQAPVRKKRGPKAGRKAALAAAAASAATSTDTASAGPRAWLAGAPSDPYAFSCDSGKPLAALSDHRQIAKHDTLSIRQSYLQPQQQTSYNYNHRQATTTGNLSATAAAAAVQTSKQASTLVVEAPTTPHNYRNTSTGSSALLAPSSLSSYPSKAPSAATTSSYHNAGRPGRQPASNLVNSSNFIAENCYTGKQANQVDLHQPAAPLAANIQGAELDACGRTESNMIAHKQQPASNPQPHQMVAPNQAGLIRQAPQYGNLVQTGQGQQTVMQHHNATPLSSIEPGQQQQQVYAGQTGYASQEDQFVSYTPQAPLARPISNAGPQLATQMSGDQPGSSEHHLYEAPGVPARPYLVKHQPNQSQVPQPQAQQHQHHQYQQQHYQATQPQTQPQQQQALAPAPPLFMEPANQYVPQMEQQSQVSRAQGRMIPQQQAQPLQQRGAPAAYPTAHLQTTVRQQPMASAVARPMQEQYHPGAPVKHVGGYQQQQQGLMSTYEPAEGPQQQVSRPAYTGQQMTLQYSTSSPTLLQQQLNRNQAQALPQQVPNQRQAQPVLVQQSQQHLQRVGPVSSFSPRPGSGPRQPMVRYVSEQALDPSAETPAGAYYQKGRPMAAGRASMEPQAVPNQVHLQQPMPGNPTPPLTPTSSVAPLGRGLVPQQLLAGDQQWPIDAPQARVQMPKNNLAQAGQVSSFGSGGCGPAYAPVAARPGPSPQQMQQHQQAPLVAPQPASGLVIDHLSHARLTLPRREHPLLGPFKLDHDIQFTSKVFHIKSPLFDILSKSMSQIGGPQAVPVIQELQFRAYTSATRHNHTGDSLLAQNHQQPGAQGRAGHCSWPELFQLSVNQQPIQLDRSKGAHKPVDIFQFCVPGDNSLDIQVNDCYCQHEFVLEPVDRPTIKAFMNSCFKSRLLDTDGCIQKLKFHFGGPNFLVQTANGIINEYLTEFVQGVEQTRAKISLRCPISGRRMRTPTRGHDCRHLQCFDLERFLMLNKDRSQWNCPICSLSIPFNMLELDQHQINIVQAMSEMVNVDDILMDSTGSWLAYSPSPQPQRHPRAPLIQQQAPVDTHHHSVAGNLSNHNHQVQQPHHQHQMVVAQAPQPATTPTTAKSTGIYHPQPMAPRQQSQQQQQQQQPMWDGQQQQQHVELPSGPVRRPASAISGQPPAASRRPNSSSPLAKRPYSGQYGPNSAQACAYSPNHRLNNDQQLIANVNPDAVDDLSPLAAMERTIIQHEQQMGPPPFDPTSLTSSPVRSSSTASNSNLTSNNQSMISSSPSLAQQVPLHLCSQASSLSQASPQHETVVRPTSAAASFSPAPPAPGTPVVPPSPSQRIVVPPSPQQQAQSPLQQQHQPQQTLHPSTNSTPVTPSSSLLVHGGPETPATPSNSCQHQQQLSSINHNSSLATPVSQQPQVQIQQQPPSSANNMDHQPLSNGSASAGSITSSSTMTPSGQSLGSVGMGGDSRCGTAPLPGTGHLGLDDLLLTGNGSQASNMGASGQFKQSTSLGQALEGDKTDILMSKLMMDPGDSLLRSQHGHSSELAMALEDAEWHQQLDRGKSEHLANFLNEPMLKQPHQQQQPLSQAQHQQQHCQSQIGFEGIDKQSLLHSGSSEDDNIKLHNNESPSQSDLTDFANYLDADTADDGAGLPPDDSILDLFER